MRGYAVVSVLAVWLAVPPAACRAEEPDVDDLRRRTLAAEDRRFRRTVELARVYASSGRLEEARGLYEEAHRLRDDDADVTEALLDVLRKLGDHHAQLPIYRRMLSVRGSVFTVRFRMGECLWRLGRTGEARRVMNDVLKRFPSERGAYLLLIDFYLAEKQSADAHGVVEHYRNRFGDDIPVLLRRARLLSADGKPGKAIDVLHRCLRLDPSEDEQHRTEQRLFELAHRTGRTDTLTNTFSAEVADLDARLAGRLTDLAEGAARNGKFADAVALVEEALPLLADPAKRAQLTARLAAWRVRVPKKPR